MSNKLYEEIHIQNIANAIREKTGKTDPLKVSGMAAEIDGIAMREDLSSISDLLGDDVGDTKSDIETSVSGLIDLANETTGNTDTNLTDGVNALVSGYGQGGSGNKFGIKHSEKVSLYFHPVLPIVEIENNAINRITTDTVKHATSVVLLTE